METMTNSEYYRTMAVGVIIGSSIMLLAFYWAKSSSETPPVTPKSNFAVVDTYKGCDVVQWTDHHMATYKYFLDCSK